MADISNDFNYLNDLDDFDPVYYRKRYGIDFRGAALEKHYRDIGVKRNYHPNREMERMYVQTMNFDPAFYRARYNLTGSDKDVLIQWKATGFVKHHAVNKCEEDLSHNPALCKCKIFGKNGRPTSVHHNHDDSDQTYTDSMISIEDSIKRIRSSKNTARTIFSKSTGSSKPSKISKISKISKQSKLSGQNRVKPYRFGLTETECDCEACMAGKIEQKKDTNRVRNIDTKTQVLQLTGKTIQPVKNQMAARFNARTIGIQYKTDNIIADPAGSVRTVKSVKPDRLVKSVRSVKTTKSVKSIKPTNSNRLNRMADIDPRIDIIQNLRAGILSQSEMLVLESDTESDCACTVCDSGIRSDINSTVCTDCISSASAVCSTCSMGADTNSSESSLCICSSCAGAVKTAQIDEIDCQNKQNDQNDQNNDQGDMVKFDVLDELRRELDRTEDQTGQTEQVEQLEHADQDKQSEHTEHVEQAKELEHADRVEQAEHVEQAEQSEHADQAGQSEHADQNELSDSDESIDGSDDEQSDDEKTDDEQDDVRSADGADQNDSSGLIGSMMGQISSIRSKLFDMFGTNANAKPEQTTDAESLDPTSDADSIRPASFVVQAKQTEQHEQAEHEQHEREQAEQTEQTNAEGLSAINSLMTIIESIVEYQLVCHRSLDAIILIFKSIFINLQEILAPSDNSSRASYDEARRKIRISCTEIDSVIRNSRYKTFPIFANPKVGSKYIGFPLYVNKIQDVELNRKIDVIVQKIRSERHNIDDTLPYYTMELIDISLRSLRLKRYIFELGVENQIITPMLNPIPPYNEFGREPNQKRYSTPELISCWSESYHLNKFEKALSKIIESKEALIANSKFLDHHRNECIKIRENIISP